MNCEAIDSIIDDHLVARLAPAERQRVAEHVSGCARCSAVWAADGALRCDVSAAPHPGLFAAVQRRIAAESVRREVAGRGLWPWLAGAAALAAVVVIAARFSSVEPETSVPPSAAASQFTAGRDYEVLPGAMARPAVAANGKIEVIEFFMFPCLPCYSFEPDLDRWEAHVPSDVSLTRVPVMWKPEAQLQARAYYTADVLGKAGAMHDAFYAEIHERGNALAARSALAELFQRFGIDRATFDATFDSSEVDARVQRAAALSREYAVAATPTLVVAGRYSTNPNLAGASSPAPLQAMLPVVDRLVAAARACRERCLEPGQQR